MKRTISAVLLVLVLAAGSACGLRRGPRIDPTRDQFYDMTRHIMTEEEIEIYRHLPDLESKKTFIREFWEKRDPNPSSEENEAYMEFMQRIEFATRWFDEHRGQMRGWDSLRGRILLQLGFPDRRKTGNSVFLTDQYERRYSNYELWYYREYGLRLLFVDRNGFGQYDFYGRYPSGLTYAVKQSRHQMPGSATRETETRFRFDADYGNGRIGLTIPVKHLVFDEQEERLSARFSFTVFTYLDYRSAGTLSQEFHFSDSKAAVLEKKEIRFEIPYETDPQGSYFMEVIGRDEQSGQRYRTFFKIRP